MNTNVESTVNTPILEENKPLAYLPGKHGKFAVYLHWLLKKFSMHAPSELIKPTSDVLIAITSLHTKDFAGQVAFYEEFFAAEKDAGKELRELVKMANKPAKKDKVMKQPKEPKVMTVKESKEPKEPKVIKEKKTRKINVIESVTNNDIIAQIVSRANSIDSSTADEVIVVPVDMVPVEVPKEKKRRVTKGMTYSEIIASINSNDNDMNAVPVKENKEPVVKEPIVKEKKEPVVKEKKEKKEKKDKKENENVNVVEVKVTEELVADTHLDQDDQEQDEDEVELQVRIMTDENGQQYYLDDAGNRYSLDLTPLDH